MKRTIKPINTNMVIVSPAKLATFASALVGRANLASKMGMQSYQGARNLYEALGYIDDLQYHDYEARYRRQDIAKAVIDRPAKATWQGPLFLQESTEADETPLEKAWKELDNTLGLKTRFSRVDRLSGIGGFGILLMGLDDVKEANDFQKPVSDGERKLLYVKPFGEGSAQISAFETDTKNPRYGMPLMYRVSISDTASGTTVTSAKMASVITVEVHYTRVIHIIDDILENEVVGQPRLEVVFNRLMDLEKVIGGDAEMFWRSARPGFQGKVDPEYQMTPETKEDLKDQIDEYEHNLRRMLVNEGVEYKALEQQVADPANHVDIQLQMISAVTGIPKRILTGTERGELSSSQDASEWRSYVEGRRLDHAEPHIVRPFVNRCIELKILPKPIKGEFEVIWSDLYAMSEAEKVKIGMDRSTAIKNYTTSILSEAILSPDAFRELCLGLTDNQIVLLKQMDLSEIEKEQVMEKAFPVPVAPVIQDPTKLKPALQKPLPIKKTPINK